MSAIHDSDRIIGERLDATAATLASEVQAMAMAHGMDGGMGNAMLAATVSDHLSRLRAGIRHDLAVLAARAGA